MTWISQTLKALGVEPTPANCSAIAAWKNSTPLSPYTNNPLGMPAGKWGANRYLNTPYGLFPSMQIFFAAIESFSKTPEGRSVTDALSKDIPAPALWRAVSSLAWPGSATETDYPSAVLDLTDRAYRASVGATTQEDRKTSGNVSANSAVKATVLDQARMTSTAGQAIIAAQKITSQTMKGKRNNGK